MLSEKKQQRVLLRNMSTQLLLGVVCLLCLCSVEGQGTTPNARMTPIYVYLLLQSENANVIHRCNVTSADEACSLQTKLENGQDAKECTILDSSVPIINITEPPFLVTNGHTKLTIECPPSNSPVDITWTSPCNSCENKHGPVCTCVPKLQQDQKYVTCTALNSSGYEEYIGRYQLNLKYPPQAEPAIDPKPKGKKVEAGSEIECTVSGGKPPVANVTLTCLQEQFRVDNRTEGNSVSSFIKVASTIQTVCTCSAYWEPKPELYRNTTRKEFTLPITCKQPASRACGLLVAAMTLFVILRAI